jgi:hypothetical protein
MRPIALTALSASSWDGELGSCWGGGSIREELYVSALYAMFRWQDRRIHVGPAYAIRPINLREARIDCARPW